MPVVVAPAIVMPAPGIRHAIQRDDATPANFTADIALEFAAAAFKLGLEPHDEPARADLTYAAAVEVHIAEAAGVPFIANGAAALADGVPAQATIAVIAITAAMVNIVPVAGMTVSTAQCKTGIATDIHRDGGARPRFHPICSSGSGEEGGRSQCNGRHSRSHDAVHHGSDCAVRVSNRA